MSNIDCDTETIGNGFSPSGLRILCLHDGDSHAAELKHALKALGDRLYQNHAITMVYINSPLPATDTAPARNLDEEIPRVWYERRVGSFVGLDASLMLLRQVWSSMPFWGILAVGQGAAVASLLPLLPVDPMPACMVFLRGEALLDEDERLLHDVPCLHVMGQNYAASERLVRQFGGQVHHSTSSTRLKKNDMNIIGKFLVEQKKKNLRETTDVLVLQNRLLLVEQEAAHMVAKHVAENPPSNLMAVISPKAVGVGSMKRRAPGEEGGGAPCPPEFLLKREKRSTDNKSGPSRVKPTGAQSEDSLNQGDTDFNYS